MTVSVENLVVSRGGKKVVHGVSFSITPKSITALLGANGAGKSSTVLALSGALPVQNGHSFIDKVEITGLAPDSIRRKGLALVPEGHRVLGQLSVEDNIRVADLSGTPSGQREALDVAYEIFPELKERSSQLASRLSGGQKQMVAMAQAFVAKPSFMIVDELSLGLAPSVVRRLADALKLAASRGIGVLLIEQFAQLALELSSHAVVLERGRVVYEGTAKALQDDPAILHTAYLAQ